MIPYQTISVTGVYCVDIGGGRRAHQESCSEHSGGVLLIMIAASYCLVNTIGFCKR